MWLTHSMTIGGGPTKLGLLIAFIFSCLCGQALGQYVDDPSAIQNVTYTYDNYVLSGSLMLKSFPNNMNAYIHYQTYDGVWNMTGTTITVHWQWENADNTYGNWSFEGTVGPYGISKFYVYLMLVESGATYTDDNNGQYYVVANGAPRSTANCDGYDVVHTSVSKGVTQLGLALNGKGCALYSPDVKYLTVSITPYSKDLVRIKIADAANKRWQIPASVVPEGTPSSHSIQTKDYAVSYTNSPFTFKVSRPSGEVLFDTSVSGLPSLIFEEEFLEISSVLPDNANIYGLGDMTDSFRRSPDTTLQTFWNLDQGTTRLNNGYGSHPVYFELRDGMVHGVFLRNSNGMDVALVPGQITYRVIGGVLDFYVFTGPTPAAALDQYTSIIGKPAFVPLWTLGFHQCRYGGTWVSTQGIKDTVDSLQQAGMYLDTVWADINYMNEYQDFTLGSSFSDWNDYVATLHQEHLHHVPIVDPGIPNVSGYGPYQDGKSSDVFLKWPNGTLFLGQVWPGVTVYADWFHPQSGTWWTNQIKKFHQIDSFDGLWIDMNEASNFVTPPGYEPAYRINNNGAWGVQGLNSRTLSTNLTHYSGISEYNVHNLFGHYEAIHTHSALSALNPGQRTFILTRSSFAGTGHYSQKWNGDNAATWDDLYLSIPQIMSNQLFGIPMVGSDICGFNGDTTEELCNRWAQLGAFYPFSRHHHSLGYEDSFFFLWESVTESALKAYTIRYTLLPYLYGLMQQASQTGNAVLRPLWWDNAMDTKTYGIDTQFTLGDGLLVTPVLTEGANTVTGYFPDGIWYDWYTGSAETTSAGYKTLDANLTHINVHVKGGIILPAQYPAKTTYATVRNPYYLIAALDKSGTASGSLYVDDGISVNPKSSQLAFNLSGNTLSIGLSWYGFRIGPKLDQVQILGYASGRAPTTIYLNGRRVAGAKVALSQNVLKITGLTIDLNNKSVLQWK
ncbi:glycosyl hydrolases family 31-domain-containing protein [Lipomyces tetrasporus]|uniref:Maltase n=1 Tax=Lipomyces tetrasporus TaxID=54092 RepID=A0AAD7QLZ3_9ASCO|nr:glycosyl hydrolases family 31-domain-containing protein [Lipomyces tetrasporus]KAJ8097684.1 glycosyl hydrolases family 31-domain-containing protein [Lipomyces tetrasporus]